MAETVFNAYGRYYDLLYHDKDYPAEVAYVQQLLTQAGMTQGDILEFGSGTGKHGRLLAQRGYRVHGIERSPDMLQRAVQADGFTCELGDIGVVKLARTFDAVLALFHVISYQITNAQLHAVFTRASEHLALGGLFLFDFWYSPAVAIQRPEVRIKRWADTVVDITRIAEPKVMTHENRVDVHYTIFVRRLGDSTVDVLEETHPMRHFSLPEIDLLAEAHGFERTTAEAFLTGEVPSPATWGVCVVLRKAR